MEALLLKLITTLTAIVAILNAQHGIHRFGAITQTVIPNNIVSTPLYDTPSGNLDAGYYSTTTDGYFAHVAVSTVASTTRPEGYYPLKKGILAHQIGTQYIFYDANNKMIGTSTDQTIGTKLRTKDAPMPTIDIAL